MNESLVDIEALALRCRTERAREFVAEAMLCYRAGAYRSAIVNTWIAVVFDLIDKIRDLAIGGDAVAQRLNTQYEGYVEQINAGNDQGTKNALEFERTVIETCWTELQFFDHQQHRDLQRLREDRHQCAHPSFLRAGMPHRPTAELARLHLRNAVEHVLSQPPVQGKSAIAELTRVVSSEYFPRDRVHAAVALQGTAIERPADAMTRGFIDSLVFGYATPGSSLYRKVQAGAAVGAIVDMHRGVAEPRAIAQLSKVLRDVADQEFPFVAKLFGPIPELIAQLTEPARLRLSEFVRAGAEADVLIALASLAGNAELEGLAKARLGDFDRDKLAAAINDHSIGCLAKDRALILLSESRNWNTSNDLFSRVITPLFSCLTRADVERIVRMPTETDADLPGASGYRKFIDEVRDQLIPSADLNELLRQHRGVWLIPDEAAE